jgi:hypothetical protein
VPFRYNEGMEILYKTNTFHIRTPTLCVFGGFIHQIPQIGRPYITSVQFVLDRRFLSQKDFAILLKVDASELDILKRVLSSLPSLMPNLQKLYLGFYPDTCLLDNCTGGSNLYYECTKPLVSLVEATARELGQLGRVFDLELGLPSTLFDRYRHEAVIQHCKVGLPGWKPGMPSKYSYHSRHRLFWPAPNRGPGTESGSSIRGEGPSVGYWISESQYDHLRDRPTACFGT